MSGVEERAVMSSSDAAKELDVTGGQVRRLFREGKLEGYKLENDQVMIYLDSLIEYKKRRKVKYGKAGGWESQALPDNTAAKRETFRGGKPKTEADKIAAGLRLRAYQRDYRRRKREEERKERERQEREAAKASRKKSK